jgi:hypothetical protein
MANKLFCSSCSAFSHSLNFLIKIFIVHSEPDIIWLSNLLYIKYLDLNWLSVGLFLTLIKDPVIPGSCGTQFP